MTSKTFTISLVLALLAGVGLGFMGGRAVFKPVGEPETQIDTIYRVRVITREKPVYLTRRVCDTMLVPVTDTIRLRDTLWLDLPREVREYGDSTYRAVVSGFRPSLDRLDIYQRERTVTRTVTLPSSRGLFVSSAYRGRGVAMAMETYIGCVAAGMGVHTLTAEVLKDNARSAAFHLKAGYVQSAEDDRYQYYTRSL